MAKTIGFTYDLKDDHKRFDGQPEDALAELDVIETINIIVRAIESRGHHIVKIGNVHNLLTRLPDLGVDIVFNICEGVGNRNRESQVPMLLDLYGIPFIGSDALSLGATLDKVMAKKLFVADGIPTPKYFIADRLCGLSNMDSMKFPFIVKPRYEGSSKGISDDSIVRDVESLRHQTEKVIEHYAQPALVEQFIVGSEFTVLIIGNETPTVYPPVQIQILKKLDLGYLIYTSHRLITPDVEYICPPKVTPELDQTLRDLALKAYRAVDCRDFGRVDFRVDQDNKPYVLEVNPLPSLSDEDVFPCIAKAVGLTYEDLLSKIIDVALERVGLN